MGTEKKLLDILMVILIRVTLFYGYSWLGLGIRLGGTALYSVWEDSVTRRLFNSNNFTTSEALAEVCDLLSAVLVDWLIGNFAEKSVVTGLKQQHA